ncbi:MAG: hypothetical protein SFY66_05615 [Oculatellaceae cyanobacterium bins.114]|nr:hypothetical protein [Oculatellaceae cyanobacterium bins.114]
MPDLLKSRANWKDEVTPNPRFCSFLGRSPNHSHTVPGLLATQASSPMGISQKTKKHYSRCASAPSLVG